MVWQSGFSHVDVLARLAGENRHPGVPVVGRGDHDGVDFLVVEHAPEVVFELWLAALQFGDIAAGLLQDLRVQVAEGLEARAGADRAQGVAVSLIAPADQRERDFFVGADGGGIQIDKGSRGDGGLEEGSAVFHA